MLPHEINLDAVLGASMDAVVIIDACGRIIFANGKAERLFGYAPGSLDGLPVDQLVSERARDVLAQIRSQACSFDIAEPSEYKRIQGLRYDGSDLPVDVSMSFSGRGHGMFVFCTIRAASEFQKSDKRMQIGLRRLQRRIEEHEAALEKSEEQLRLFVRHMPAGVAMLDKEMRYLAVSDRWLEDYDLAKRNIIGLCHYDVFPEIPERWKQAHQRCLAGEPQKCEEDSFVRLDGKVEWVRWELLPWRNRKDEIGGIMLLFEIITQRKQAEIALHDARVELEQLVAARTEELNKARVEAEAANQLKTRILAAIGHDLRQPLQAALTYLCVLCRGTKEAALLDVCGKERLALESMGGILDSMLDFASLQEGRIVPHPADFRISDAVNRVLASSLTIAAQKGLTVVADVDNSVVHTDPALLGRILENLMANAIRYTDKGGVTLKATRQAEGVSISISDTGIGIPTSAQHAIFEPYVQIGNHSRDRSKGLGLGLSIVKQLTTLLNLPLNLRSTEGEGSTFEILVPSGTTPSPNDAEARAPQASMSASPYPVLVVDDDQWVRESLVTLLNLSGFGAIGASNGEEALALVGTGQNPRVIITDLCLPGCCGLDVITGIRAQLGRQVPAVLMTGDKSMSQANLAEIPVCHLVHKPVDADRLIELTTALCKG